MRIGNLLPSRPQWYDRAPVMQGNAQTNPGIAPHGATTRLAYTVPAAKKALIESASIYARRATAAAPVGLWEVYGFAAGAGLGTPQIPIARSLDNTVNAVITANASLQLVLLAGYTYNMADQDVSTGGTVDYYCAFKATEYDA